MKISNEEKAKEICGCDNCKACIKFAEKGAAYALSSTCDMFDELTQAMEWKDEQIDTIMLTIEGCLRSFFESQGNSQKSIDNFIDALKTQINENLNNFKQTMKGEQQL